MNPRPRIAVFGRPRKTGNYESFLSRNSFEPLSTMSLGELASCDGLILPGGGDIDPVFFGERNRGSRNIDTESDILQFQALELCLRGNIPVLGICKGMQIINVAFGGNIIQDMEDSSIHIAADGDLYHPTAIEAGSVLHDLYGGEALVNSAHHQCVGRVGRDLRVIQRCPDGCPEALIHTKLPVLGLQWHPERLDPARAGLSGADVLTILEAWILASRQPSNFR